MNEEDTEKLCEDMGDEMLRIANLPKPEQPVCGKELLDFVRTNSQRVLFYPACGHDWEPLSHLSNYCDVFLYCDKGLGGVTSISSFDAALRDIHTQTSAGDRLRFEEAKELESPDPVGCESGGGWAARAILTLRMAGGIRRLTLIYVLGYGEVAYRTLFQNQSVSPRIICIRCPDAGGHDLLHREGTLPQLVHNATTKPEFLVTHYPPLDGWAWDWNRVVHREFEGWSGVSLLARST